MKKTALFITTLALTAAFISCQKKENTDIEEKSAVKTFAQLEKVKWLLGSWGDSSKNGDLTETWTQLNDSTLAGKTIFISGKDTLFTETIQIIQQNDTLYYNTQVSNQNEGKAVSFKNTSLTDSQLLFENPKHDFPQRVDYKKINTDSLVAEVSGVKNGKPHSEAYPMKKKK